MKIWRYGCAIERLGNRYRLDGTLGSGGMADVCLAWDEHEKREVAIKVIKTDNLSLESLNRFLKEGSLVVGWNHPHILRVYDDIKLELLDKARGSMVPYIVTEYVQGGDLKQRLTRGQPYLPSQTLSIFSQLCKAIQYAHEQNVIHRDLKPSNVLFRRLPNGTEQAVLSDFGLAVSIDASHFTFPEGGTPAYMSPEQWRGQAQKASDIFALGVIFYQLCTGYLPFQFTPSPLIPPTRPSKFNPALPSALDEVIFTALAEDPTRRFTTARQFWKQVRSAVSTNNDQKPATDPLPANPSPNKEVNKANQSTDNKDIRKNSSSSIPNPVNLHENLSESARHATNSSANRASAAAVAVGQPLPEEQIDARDQAEQQGKRELQQTLLQAILSIPNPMYRRVLLYLYIAGLDEQGVAQRLQVPRQHVKPLREKALIVLNTKPEVIRALRSLSQ